MVDHVRDLGRRQLGVDRIRDDAGAECAEIGSDQQRVVADEKAGAVAAAQPRVDEPVCEAVRQRVELGIRPNLVLEQQRGVPAP